MRQFVLFKSLLRASCPAAIVLILFVSTSLAQFQKFGLEGDTVYSLRLYGMKVYAGTQRGAFVRSLNLADSPWTPIGLKGKRIRAIYPHNYGPIGYAVTAGIDHPIGDSDSALTYCTFYSDTAWAPTDTGMDRSRFRYVSSADGFPSATVCGETFVTTATTAYRRGGPVWEPVLDMGVAKLNVVRTLETGLTTGMVYVGGETAIFAPYIKSSTDKGATWSDATIPYHGDDACYSFCFDPAKPTSMYAGMEGSVLQSTDGGKSWTTSGLSGTSYYFLALAADPANGNIFAGGAASVGPGRFGLYKTTDHGTSWSPISITDSLNGILSMAMIPTALPEVNLLLVGTLGSGVLLTLGVPVSVPSDIPPAVFELKQNYPNPFNPSTQISYLLPAASVVHLTMYDVLGREVASLVNGVREQGQHSIVWDAKGLASGVYYCKLVAIAKDGQQRAYTEVKKVILLR
jgi:hypothetical protein